MLNELFYSCAFAFNCHRRVSNSTTNLFNRSFIVGNDFYESVLRTLCCIFIYLWLSSSVFIYNSDRINREYCIVLHSELLTGLHVYCELLFFSILRMIISYSTNLFPFFRTHPINCNSLLLRHICQLALLCYDQ